MLSLYIHVPFCVQKCHYCGFYSTPYLRGDADSYLEALALEFEHRNKELTGEPLETIYLGGGTPTVLSKEQFEKLFRILKSNFVVESSAEFTIEANPHTVTLESLRFLRRHGVSRLSLGIQSFSDNVLHTLGRIHAAEEGPQAFFDARKAGFQNIGIDLIFGVPGQSTVEWEDTLEVAFRLHPEHISAYMLSLDEGAKFSALAKEDAFSLPDDEIVGEMHAMLIEKMKIAGYRRYEVSNYCRTGFECRHNRNYWNRGSYAGFGPSAASFIKEKRFENIKDTASYVARLRNGSSIIVFEEVLQRDAIACETLLLGLRTAEGVDMEVFRERFEGLLSHAFWERLDGLVQDSLLIRQDGFLRLTERGFLLADYVLRTLVI